MAPKKKPRNAFFIFTTEWKARKQREGKNYSISEATRLAGEIWKDMTAAERAPFNNKAKNERYESKNANEKYTSDGVPLSYIDNEQREQEATEKMMKQQIQELIDSGLETNSLADEKLFFIMGNYFSKTPDSGIYIPAEIGLSEYSLRDGVTRKFHSYVNPNVCLFGHAYETQVHTDSTHQLPLPPTALGESNLGQLYNRILDFIHPEEGRHYPAVYTLQDDIPIVKSILNFLKSDTDGRDVDIEVYSIHYLFYAMKKATAEVAGIIMPASIYVTSAYFDQGLFEFHDGIACDYHEKNDKSKYCALACVVRWGYTFSNYMCSDLCIELKQGAHVPEDTVLPVEKPENDSKYHFNATSSYYETDGHSTISGTTSRISYIKEEPREYSLISQPLDFPPLGRGNRSHSNVTNITLDDSSSVAAAPNPWKARSVVVPREPQAPFGDFDFENIVPGKGRGLSMRDSFNDSGTFGVGRGRGHLIKQEWPPAQKSTNPFN